MPSSTAFAAPAHRQPFEGLSLNERDMLNRLRLAGVLTRADLSRGTGLTVQTAVRLIESLQARGMVRMGEGWRGPVAASRASRCRCAPATGTAPGSRLPPTR